MISLPFHMCSPRRLSTHLPPAMCRCVCARARRCVSKYVCVCARARASGGWSEALTGCVCACVRVRACVVRVVGDRDEERVETRKIKGES